jgi:hypothetical protein
VHAHGLDDLRAGAARDLRAVARPLVAVQLDEIEPEPSTVRATWSSVAFWKTPASSTWRFEAATMSAASDCLQRRLEEATKIMPSAQAPWPAQSSASSTLVMPQCLTASRVRR